jgi:tetratricopeptide (TPR) repeat protein
LIPQLDPAAIAAIPGPGSVLADRYVLGALLGKGGMGHVYAARDRKLQRDVAVKLLGSAVPDREALRRFGREALAAGAVQHPNVVAVFDAGEEGGRPFLVTELLRGRTLRAALEAGPLPLESAQSCARQVAAGLAAAHDKGFIHRDLKPENIFILEDGWVKILDFGLVKLTESLHATPPPEGSNSTADGRMLGTVGYMAPEQVRGQTVDPRCDVFNFGLVLYEMLGGARAFRGNSGTETSYAILFKEPAPLPKSVPGWLRQLTLHCLEKDREKRPATAREILDALQKKTALGPRRKLRVSRAVPIAALLVAAAAVVFFAGPRKPRQPVLAPPAVKPAGSVAIMPFDVHDAPDYAVLAEGMSDLLARDFEGGGLHAVNTDTATRLMSGANTGDLDRARMAAAQLGARYFILGRLEQKNGTLRIEGVLHDAETGNPITQGSARGEAAALLRSIRELSDELQGLKRTPQEFQQRLATLALHTSSSPEAVLAWLEGERLLREVKFDQSFASFRRSVAADREFALAHYKLGTALIHTNPLSAEEEFELAMRYKDHLKPADQLLVKAHLALQRGFHAEAEGAFEEATREFPGDGEAWLELGDYLFHWQPIFGRSPEDAAAPLQRALSFDPASTEAIYHLADLGILRGERQTVATMADRLLGLTDDVARSARYRMSRAWARNDQVEHDEALAVAKGLHKQGSFEALTHAFNTESWLMDPFGDLLGVAQAIGKRDGFQADAAAYLIHGRPDAARAAFVRASADYPSGDTPVHAVWLDTLTEFAISPAQLKTARANAAQLLAKLSSDDDKLPLLVYLGGVLAVRAHDSAAAEDVARRLESMPTLGNSSIVADLALALRARIQEQRGNAAAALQLLEKQRLMIPLRYIRYYTKLGEWFLRADLLTALKRPREALPLYDALSFYSYSEPIFRPVAFLRKARIYEAMGQRQRAIEAYESFAIAWKNCEASEQPLLEEAQRELNRLKY